MKTNRYIFIIIGLIITILISSGVLAATYYVTDPSSCPATDSINFAGQSCSPTNICGDSGGNAQCYDTSTLTSPTGSFTTTGSGGTDYTCVGTACSGGFITNCYSTLDSSSPFCDNNGDFLCDRNSTCYNKHVQTTCTGGSFATSTCSASCTTNYFACDGSTTDVDGCEINAGSSCGSGTGTIVNNQCYSASAGNCTNGVTKFDCDNDDSDSNTATCNGVNGCEITEGGSCSVGVLAGTYSECTCVTTPQNFITLSNTLGSSNATNPLLWGTDYGDGWLMNLTGTSGSLLVNGSGCIKFNDGSVMCNSSSGPQGEPGTNGTDGTNLFTSINLTQMDNSTGVLNILESWLNSLFYTKTLVDNLISSIGNWTADKGDYSTKAQADALYSPINYGDEWNKTYADTLYADISVTGGGNTSWNQTYADTLYADISVVDTDTTYTNSSFDLSQLANTGNVDIGEYNLTASHYNNRTWNTTTVDGAFLITEVFG